MNQLITKNDTQNINISIYEQLKQNMAECYIDS